MAERLKARAWRARVPQKGTVGSNPTLSATQSAVAETLRRYPRASQELPRFRGVLERGTAESEPETASSGPIAGSWPRLSWARPSASGSRRAWRCREPRSRLLGVEGLRAILVEYVDGRVRVLGDHHGGVLLPHTVGQRRRTLLLRKCSP